VCCERTECSSFMKWKHHPLWCCDMWPIFINDGTFLPYFCNHGDLELFQITQTTMDKFRRSGRCPRRKILHLNETCVQSSCCGIQSNSSSCNASPDHKQIQLIFFHFKIGRASCRESEYVTRRRIT